MAEICLSDWLERGCAVLIRWRGGARGAATAGCFGTLVLLCGSALSQAVPTPAPVPSTPGGMQTPAVLANPAAVPQASKTETPEQAQQRINSSLADIGPGL